MHCRFVAVRVFKLEPPPTWASSTPLPRQTGEVCLGGGRRPASGADPPCEVTPSAKVSGLGQHALHMSRARVGTRAWARLLFVRGYSAQGER